MVVSSIVLGRDASCEDGPCEAAREMTLLVTTRPCCTALARVHEGLPSYCRIQEIRRALLTKMTPSLSLIFEGHTSGPVAATAVRE